MGNYANAFTVTAGVVSLGNTNDATNATLLTNDATAEATNGFTGFAIMPGGALATCAAGSTSGSAVLCIATNGVGPTGTYWGTAPTQYAIWEDSVVT